MTTSQFYSDVADLDWLRETHLRRLTPPEFHSFILFGNEDCPKQINLYAQAMPIYSQSPIAEYVLDADGGYRDCLISDERMTP